MRMMRFQFTIVHIPGKELVIADALSRSPLKHFCKTDKNLQADCDAYVNLILNNLPATDKHLKQLQQAQDCDKRKMRLANYCFNFAKKAGQVNYTDQSNNLNHALLSYQFTMDYYSREHAWSSHNLCTQKYYKNSTQDIKASQGAVRGQSNQFGGLVSVNRLKKQFRNV